jgi:transposase InsO family protein
MVGDITYIPTWEGWLFLATVIDSYTSYEFARTLKMHNLRQSVSRTGICYDNAMAESFFAALKNECVYRTQYPTREHARRDIVRCIEFRYNSRRRHSGLQYRTPQQVHNEYWNSSQQRELTTNPLSGKLGADHTPAWVFGFGELGIRHARRKGTTGRDGSPVGCQNCAASCDLGF